MNATDKYLKITAWARKRYAINGCLAINSRNVFSTYSMIERAAWLQYIANPNR